MRPPLSVLLTDSLLAADPAAASNLPLYIVAGIAALSTIAAAVFAMKGTFRTADVAREQAFDAQLDKDRTDLRVERDALLARCATLTSERDLAREQLARLRLAVLTKLNRDPDTL